MGRRGAQRSRDGESRLDRGARLATIVGAPIALVGVVIATLAFLGGGGDGAEPSASPDAEPRLEAVDLIGRGDQRGSRAGVELLVRNAGSGRSVISEAQLEVLRKAELPRCFSQGTLPVSERYGVPLSVDAEPGETIAVPLHQQVGPDEADRFLIEFSLTDPRQGDEAEFDRVTLFELDVSLIRDGDSEPLPMGTTLIALPEVPFEIGYYLAKGQITEVDQSYNGSGTYQPDEIWGRIIPCWRQNAAALASFAGAEAASSAPVAEAIEKAVKPSLAELGG